MSTRVVSSRQAEPGSRQEASPQMGVLGFLASACGKLKSDRSGEVAITFGLISIIMFVLIGGAVDYGRWLHASKQTKTAIDSAVLAGARVMQLQGTGATAQTNAKAAAMKYYKENVKTRLATVNDTVAFVIPTSADSITATGNVQIKTPLLSVLSILDNKDHNTMPLMKPSAADFPVAKLKVGGNAENSIEIAMMLDTSGSMSGQKLIDMKAAAVDLINIVVWDNQTTYTSKVSIAPFSADVRLPTTMNDAARGTRAATILRPGTCTTGSGQNKQTVACDKTYTLTPCVVERAGSNRYTDAAPGTNNYVMGEYVAGTSTNCNQGAANVIVPLTNNKTTLINAVNGLVLGGGTAGHLGTAWAWYTLSPNWNALFPASNQPQAYGTAKLQKIAILMTDGEYNTEFSVNGINTDDALAGTIANASSVNQAKALCDGMKAKGITVYTVGFDLGGNTTAINTLSYCASSTNTFYQASSGSDLRQAFRDIALKVSDLYLSQ
jgi:Flp pilus assembly protein TadG